MTTLPDCMVPDGGEGPCAGYNELLREYERLVTELAELTDRLSGRPRPTDALDAEYGRRIQNIVPDETLPF